MWEEEVAVDEHAGEHAAAANGGYDCVEIGEQQRFATGEREDVSAEVGQTVHAVDHDVGGDGRRVVVVLVAIGAGEIAAANGDDVRHDGMDGPHRAARDRTEFPQTERETFPPTPNPNGRVSHAAFRTTLLNRRDV